MKKIKKSIKRGGWGLCDWFLVLYVLLWMGLIGDVCCFGIRLNYFTFKFLFAAGRTQAG